MNHLLATPQFNTLFETLIFFVVISEFVTPTTVKYFKHVSKETIWIKR
jgi:hypothetical protein